MAVFVTMSQQQAFMFPTGHIVAPQRMVVGPPPELLELAGLPLLLELMSPLLLALIPPPPLLALLVEVVLPLRRVEAALLLAGIWPFALVAEPQPVLHRPSAPPTPPQPKAKSQRPAAAPSEIQ